MKIIDRLLNYADTWSFPHHVYMFTGNPVIKRNGAIVMGRGAAREVRDLYPGIDQRFGKLIQEQPDKNIVFLPLDDDHPGESPKQYLGWFKVKDHWADPADIDIIRASVDELRVLIVKHWLQEVRFHLNYPGIGNGGLTEADVLPVLQKLPDNVLIYR